MNDLPYQKSRPLGQFRSSVRIFVLRALLNGAQAELNWGILAEKQAAVIVYLKTALVAGKVCIHLQVTWNFGVSRFLMSSWLQGFSGSSKNQPGPENTQLHISFDVNQQNGTSIPPDSEGSQVQRWPDMCQKTRYGWILGEKPMKQRLTKRRLVPNKFGKSQHVLANQIWVV